QGEYTTITLPLTQGIVQARKSEFPDAEDDVSKKPEAYAERWIATSSGKGTLGVLWEPGVAENEMGWAFSLLTEKLSCLPQTFTEGAKFYVYVGSGDWRTVRRYACRLAGSDGEREDIPVLPRPVHNARFEPSPLVTVNNSVTPSLVVDNLRGKPLQGSLQIQTAEGVVFDRDQFTLEGLTRDKKLSEPVKIQLPPGPAVHTVNLKMETQIFDTQIPAPIVRLGDEQQVDIHLGDRIRLDNGLSQFDINPAFTGALTSWIMDGRNHVLSPYPDVKSFGWMSPWYGGLTPMVISGGEEDFPGKLYREKLDVEQIADRDRHGLSWYGVRLKTNLVREKLLGLDVALDYLTVGGSNVLKLVTSVQNNTTAERGMGIGWITFWQPDGSAEHNILHSHDMQRKPTPWYSWAKTGHWAAVTNSVTRRSAAMVSPYPEVSLMDWGDAGSHLGAIFDVHVPPSATVRRTVYLVLCDDLKTAKSYAVLKDYID
ncbi:MAG: hypothetical protein P1S60_05470, partial [Anaerolineae bacterium]|nr:hypothetical protein [Anaerolineae bacterium]